MSIATTGELKTAVGNWIARDGDVALVSRIPDFIGLFERAFNRKMRVTDQEKTATLTSVSGSYALPDDLVKITNLSSGSNPIIPLEPTATGFLDSIMPRTGTTPRFYSVNGNAIQIAPDNGGDLALRYVSKVELGQADASTNWLLTKWPDAYLFGTIFEAFMFSMDHEQAAIWKARLDGVLDEITAADNAVRWNGASRRARGVCP